MQSSILLILLLAISAVVILTQKERGPLKPFDRATTDSLRGLLALLIVGHHLAQNTSVPVFSYIVRDFGMPIVAMFFMLSGYGLYYSYKRKGQAYLKGFLRTRYSKILPLFILLTAIEIAAAWYSGVSLSRQATSFIVNGAPPLRFSWFIYAIIYVYASFYLSAVFGRTCMRTGLVFLAFSVAYMVFIGLVFDWDDYWYVTLPAVNLGYFIGYYEEGLSLKIEQYPILFLGLSILMIVCTYCGIYKLPDYTYTPESMWKSVWALNQAFAIYLIVRLFGMVRWKPLVWISMFSLELYLIHGIPLTLISRYFSITETYEEVLLIIATYLISILLAWLAHKIIYRKRDSERVG